MTINVCLAGATGWAGSSLTKAIQESDDMQLVGAISRKHAGKPLGDALGIPMPPLLVSSSAKKALNTTCDVFVEFTHPDIAKHNILAALDAGAHVVVGTSGLTDEDYEEINGAAQASACGVIAAGNFALTAVLLQRFAEIAAKHIPYWEIVDYAHSHKVDAPSGTVRELAHRMGKVRKPIQNIPVEEINGLKESRGATLNGSQIHAIRLPGYVIGAEVIFGMPDQKLILRHEAGASSEPYVAGAMLAIRKVGTFTGLKRGLDTLMEFS